MPGRIIVGPSASARSAWFSLAGTGSFSLIEVIEIAKILLRSYIITSQAPIIDKMFIEDRDPWSTIRNINIASVSGIEILQESGSLLFRAPNGVRLQ